MVEEKERILETAMRGKIDFLSKRARARGEREEDERCGAGADGQEAVVGWGFQKQSSDRSTAPHRRRRAGFSAWSLVCNRVSGWGKGLGGARGRCAVILLTVPVAGNKLILRSVVVPKGVAFKCKSCPVGHTDGIQGIQKGLGFRV